MMDSLLRSPHLLLQRLLLVLLLHLLLPLLLHLLLRLVERSQMQGALSIKAALAWRGPSPPLQDMAQSSKNCCCSRCSLCGSRCCSRNSRSSNSSSNNNSSSGVWSLKETHGQCRIPPRRAPHLAETNQEGHVAATGAGAAMMLIFSAAPRQQQPNRQQQQQQERSNSVSRIPITGAAYASGRASPNPKHPQRLRRRSATATSYKASYPL